MFKIHVYYVNKSEYSALVKKSEVTQQVFLSRSERKILIGLVKAEEDGEEFLWTHSGNSVDTFNNWAAGTTE